MPMMIIPFVLRTLATLDTSLVRTEREGERERWEHADASTRRSSMQQQCGLARPSHAHAKTHGACTHTRARPAHRICRALAIQQRDDLTLSFGRPPAHRFTFTATHHQPHLMSPKTEEGPSKIAGLVFMTVAMCPWTRAASVP